MRASTCAGAGAPSRPSTPWTPHMTSARRVNGCGALSVAHDTRVHRLVAANAKRPRALGLDKAARPLRDLRPRRFRLEYRIERGRERLCVVGRAKKSRFAVAHELAVPADVGCDEHASP